MKTDFDFDDLSEPAEARPSKDGQQAGVMWLGTCYVNSVEAQIGEATYQEKALEIDVTFSEDDDLPIEQILEAPAVSATRAEMARMYAAHRSLARSLGPRANYAQYVELCLRERMSPIK